ncbi:hypothetical protein DFQ27_007081 [Actinomortierella ambigua]|uniref:Uncharacterized protein n=1 Tax=Actinomortierella ambigua TaxID=1343610 RepID=A0A9P6PXA0_9FUNG|nr:hypothetical protein DFQ27_007081 [Actinomortierella ambigua]
MTKSAFWNTVRKALAVNPKVTTGMPEASQYRIPAPGGQPKTHVPNDPLANDIAQNPYYGRDFRRNYPRLAVYSQQEVAGLLVANPALAIESGEAAIAKAGEDVALTEVLKSAKGQLYTASNLPPTPVIASRKYKWIKSPDQPPVDAAAFPWIPNAADPGLDGSPDADIGIHPLADADTTLSGPLSFGLGVGGPTPLGSDPGLITGASGGASSQVVQAPPVELDHQVLIQPETSVIPVSRLQPIINIAPPIIHIDPFYDSLYGGYTGAGLFDNYGMNAGILGGLYGYGGGDSLDYGGLPLSGGPGLTGAPLMKRQLGGGSAFGGLGGPSTLVGGGPAPFGAGSGGMNTGLATDTVIQPIVNIETYTPAPVPVSNPIPYQYPVPYSVGTPFPVRTFRHFERPFWGGGFDHFSFDLRKKKHHGDDDDF